MLNHIKLFEGYFTDKKREIEAEADKKMSELRKEFQEEISCYVELFSDEFNNSHIDNQFGGSSTSILTMVSFTINTQELEKLLTIYNQIAKISNTSKEFFIQMSIEDDTSRSHLGISSYGSYDKEIKIDEIFKMIMNHKDKRNKIPARAKNEIVNDGFIITIIFSDEKDEED